MEQRICRREDQQWTTFEKHAPSGRLLVLSRAAVCETSCAVVVDGVGRDREYGKGRQNCKKRHEVEARHHFPETNRRRSGHAPSGYDRDSKPPSATWHSS